MKPQIGRIFGRPKFVVTPVEIRIDRDPKSDCVGLPMEVDETDDADAGQ